MAAAVTVGLLGGAGMTAAEAGTTPKQSVSTNPVVTHPAPGPFTIAAGAICAFDVAVAFPVTDLTRYTWNAQGRPVFAMESGTMLVDFTNTATGTSVRRDLSGTGYYVYPDATTVILSGTRVLALLGPADSPSSKLLFSNGGFMSFRVVTMPDGSRVRTVLVQPAQAEDLCETLG
jgi:hypothetical protein